MPNLTNQVDPIVEEYEKYLVAGAYLGNSATCLDLPEVMEEESPTLDKKEPKYEKIWEFKLPVPPESDVGSNFITLVKFESHFPEPLVGPLESPFDVLDETLPDMEKIRQLIGFMIDESKIEFARKLADRLHFLYEAVQEDPEEGPVLPGSLINFISFLRNTPKLKYPDVVLTPSNEISAQWRTAPNRHFAVVFQATGEVRFVIFTPNPKDPAKIDRLSGITSVEALMAVSEPHGVLDWAAR